MCHTNGICMLYKSVVYAQIPEGIRSVELRVDLSVQLGLAKKAAIYRSAQGPGPESAPRSAFSVFLGTWLRVPQRVLFECFLAFLGLKNAKKHSKSTLWGTRRQVPKNTEKALRGALSGPGP